MFLSEGSHFCCVDERHFHQSYFSMPLKLVIRGFRFWPAMMMTMMMMMMMTMTMMMVMMVMMKMMTTMMLMMTTLLLQPYSFPSGVPA